MQGRTAGILVSLGCLAQVAVAPYTGTCPEYGAADGTRVHNGQEWQDAPLTATQTAALANFLSPALGQAAAAAIQANLDEMSDCNKNAPCFVACVVVTDRTCAENTGEPETPERAASAQLDTCAVVNVDSNWPGNPAVPAKTATQDCNQAPGCKYSGSACVADSRDIPMLEATLSCTYAENDANGVRLGTASERKAACEVVDGCEYSNGPYLGWPSTAEACSDDEGAAMGCRLSAATVCGTHREAMGRAVADNGWECPPPPPAPAATSAGARTAGELMLGTISATCAMLLC